MSIETVTFDSTKHWRAEDLLEIDDERHRYEINDGVLEVTPPPTVGHSHGIGRLIAVLVPQLLPGLECTTGVGLQIGRSYREPDLCVIRAGSLSDEAIYSAPGDMLVAVEVVSPSSRATDRLIKPAEYAAAGVPLYVRVERDEPAIVVYQLDDGASAYRIVRTFHIGDVIELTAPISLTIAVADILS